MASTPLASGMARDPLVRVGLFTAAYLIAAALAASRARNLEFVFYIAVLIGSIACIVWIHSRVGLTPGLLWGLSIWGALHMAGGLVTVPDHWPTDGGFRVLYSWWIIPAASGGGQTGGWLKYDQVVHAYGFGMASWLCWQGLQGALSDRARGEAAFETALRPTPGLMCLVAAAGMGRGALNEVVEFVATRITVTNVGGYVDTGWDLVFNLLGSSTAALLIGLSGSRRPRPRDPGD